MNSPLENVRCRFCATLFPRPVAEAHRPKECSHNDCLRTRRFAIVGALPEEHPAQIFAIRTAIRDRSNRPMNS